ncbi:MAG TPA: RNA polymerase sigma factor, partial [Polyangiaceae bacterium]|nr:RNA polymerase sigma factor [Polyangiaceae bacterium]
MAYLRERWRLPWTLADARSDDSSVPPPARPLAPGARVAGARLVHDHFDFIWRLIRRLGLSPEDADDVAQQVFMTATQKITDITPGHERTYLYGVALRATANIKRKAHRRREHADSGLANFRDQTLPPDHAAELVRARQLLDELLATLPEELRRVFVLANVEQFELAEIAELEGIPQGTVASRLRRARALFAERLSQVRQRSPFRR